jgi:hypothetical protein
VLFYEPATQWDRTQSPIQFSDNGGIAAGGQRLSQDLSVDAAILEPRDSCVEGSSRFVLFGSNESIHRLKDGTFQIVNTKQILRKI